MPKDTKALRDGYDQVAEEYVTRIFDELAHKPFDRELLDRYAVAARGLGLICEIGCGPGHVARYLAERGSRVFGIDLSPRMVELARRLNPGLEFQQGTMAALDAADAAWGGIVAFYSIIHIPRTEVVDVLREFKRVLRPDGLLLLAFHVGQEVVHLDEWWEQSVSIDFVFFERAEMEAYLEAAGFAIEESLERSPYEGVEHPSRRAYILARKPGHLEHHATRGG